MNDGLITRIGKWMDRKWAAKATWLDVQEQESKCSERHIGALSLITELKTEAEAAVDNQCGAIDQRIDRLEKKFTADIFGLRSAITDLTAVTQAPSEVAKELATLKTRLEQLEIYTNMSRKVDPTKAAVAKSAFAM